MVWFEDSFIKWKIETCKLILFEFQNYVRTYFRRKNSMVYFWTYAHPSYCPSDLLARGFTAARWTSGRSARPRNCRNLTWPSNNTKINSCRRSDMQFSGCAIGRMGSRADQHYQKIHIVFPLFLDIISVLLKVNS